MIFALRWGVISRYPTRRAEQLCRKVIAIQKKVLGPRHPDVMMSLSNLGGSLYDQDRIGEALSIYRPLINDLLVVYGSNHPETIRIMRHFNYIDNQARVIMCDIAYD